MYKTIVILMAVICAVVLLFGYIHWKNVSKEAGRQGKMAAEKINHDQLMVIK